MTPAEIEAETGAAVKALVHRLRNHGDTDLDGPDAEVFAAEFVAAMKARGWRPTPARQSPDWRHQVTEGQRAARGEISPANAAALEAIKRGDLEGSRKILGTTSVVPVQPASPESTEDGQ